MKYETYELEASNSFMTFEFISEGTKGFIKKRVQYQETKQNNIYNLAFGDVNIDTQDFDDTIVTNNNDIEKVLATVAATLFAFLKKYPNAYIYAEGSTRSRNRLYQIGISKNIEEIKSNFKIYGLTIDGNWVIYEKGNNYFAFILKLKN